MIRAGLNIDHEEFPRAKIKEVKYSTVVPGIFFTNYITNQSMQ